MPYIDGCIRTFTAGGAVAAHTLVKLSAGAVVENSATATDDAIGVAEFSAASSELVAVRLINTDGTIEMTAAGVIANGADVYAAANGKIQALPVGAGTYRKVGIALEAAAADGEIIEVMPYDYQATTTV